MKATAATRNVLSLASVRCEQLGLQLTPTRRDLLKVLALEQRPLGAYVIAERLGALQERRIAPALAYRGLKFLVDAGLVARLESQNSYVLCAYPDCGHDCVFLICKSCDWVEEVVDEDVVKRLADDAESAGFVPERQVIEVMGQCQSCQLAANDRQPSRKNRQKKNRPGKHPR